MSKFGPSYTDRVMDLWTKTFERNVCKGETYLPSAQLADQAVELFKERYPEPPPEPKEPLYKYVVVDCGNNECGKYETWQEAQRAQKNLNLTRGGHIAKKLRDHLSNDERKFNGSDDNSSDGMFT